MRAITTSPIPIHAGWVINELANGNEHVTRVEFNDCERGWLWRSGLWVQGKSKFTHLGITDFSCVANGQRKIRG